MATEYAIVLLDPRGKRLPLPNLTAFNSLEYARKVNDVGSLTLTLPSQYPLYWFGKDYRLEVWRKLDLHESYCDGNTQWLIRKINLSRTAGERVLTVTAQDLNSLLKRRIVAYDASTPEASKADFADDMMKEIMFENFGLGAVDPDRDISAWLDIQGDFGLAMPVEKAFSRRIVLPIFQELCQYSYENGIFLAFEVGRKEQNKISFKTFINQLGVDHTKGSPNPLLFGSKYGNLTNDQFVDDGTDEETFIYAGGQGTEEDRVIMTAQDDARIGISPFGRIEGFVDARQDTLPASVQTEADAELRSHQSKKTISGTVADTDSCRYGLHYKFGDKVTVETEETSMDAFINAIHVTVSGGKETVDLNLEAVWQ